MGLSLRPIRGKCDSLEDLDYAYSLHDDGVQYVLCDFGEYESDFDDTTMLGCIENLQNIANSSRHDVVKQIQQFLEKNLGTPIWSLVGSDHQMAVAFGNEDGYVAQLIMDFSSEEKFLEYKAKITQSLLQMGIAEDKMPDIQDIEEFVVIPAEEKYDAMFKKLNIPGVVVDYFDPNDDDFYIELDPDDDYDDDEDD